MVSAEDYRSLRDYLNQLLPLNDHVVYSLPEGLWVFCITVTSGFFYFQLGRRRVSLVLLPIAVACVMELFQLFHISGGRFDWIDVLFVVMFWVLGIIVSTGNRQQRLSFAQYNARTIVFLATYMIVYLAHVKG